MSLYFLHLTSIRCITSLSTSLYPWLKDPRYLNFSLLAMTLVSILTSTSSSWVMSLHLQSKYSILVLPNLNPLKSQVCVQPLAYCQSIQCHLQNIHPWICRSAFIIKANKNGLSMIPGVTLSCLKNAPDLLPSPIILTRVMDRSYMS